MSYKTERIFQTYADAKVLDLHGFHQPRPNKKTGSIPGWALLPGVTCSGDSCNHCFIDGCYAVKNALCHGYDIEKNNCLRAWTENTVLVANHVDIFKEEMIKYLQKNKPAFFRIHTSGDFINTRYANVWFDIAVMFPGIKFLAFTKKWNIARSVPFYILENFSLVLSGWTGVEIPEDLREHYPCAWCNDGQETRIPNDALKCPGKCETCGLCWELKNIKKDTYFNKH